MDKHWAKVQAAENQEKNTIDLNSYAANLPEKHIAVKAETWEWTNGKVKA